MAGDQTKEILETLLDKITAIAATKTVVGEPVIVGNRVIVPVVKVSIGVGAGSGEGKNPKGSESSSSSGSGAGAGVSIMPIAFMVMDDKNVHLFGTKPNVLDNLTAKLPDLISSVLDKIPFKKEKSETSKKEEKSEEE
ncbi:MAG: spore germination protein GerW family protein [bacterium]|nr:spore germination protein GerW family protein [bacterium]